MPTSSGPTTLPARQRTQGLPPRARSWRTRPLGSDLVVSEVTARLAGRADVLTFRDRRMPMGRGAIDLITLGPGGVTVVGALLVRGTTITVARGGGGFAEPRGLRLLAGGRDHTAAAALVERQVTAVRHALSEGAHHALGVPPVRGALCLPDADGLPPFTTVRVHEVEVDGPEGVAWLAARRGELRPEQVLRLARRLEHAFARR
ncbi:MAG: hypothetical protein MUC84_07875 [Solirubrobacteraceae bacterium]|jgi:hypothetical protein|nr:hypothetical protein [Solirubrobacteraceae bacterium]